MAPAVAVAGAQGLAGVLQQMAQQEELRKQRILEAQKQQIDQAGQYGQNQQQMLAQLMSGYKTALGV